jgi:hypothetical protein
VDGRTRHGGRALGPADVIRMEMGDDDPRDREPPRKLDVELRGLREGEAGVDERPAVGALEEVAVDVPRPRRKRQRQPLDAVGDLDERRLGSERGQAATLHPCW